MASNQATDGSAPFGGRVPSHVKSAASDWVRELDYQNRNKNIGESHLYRQALYEFFLNHWEEISEEAKQNLEKEHLEDQVSGGLGIDL